VPRRVKDERWERRGESEGREMEGKAVGLRRKAFGLNEDSVDGMVLYRQEMQVRRIIHLEVVEEFPK